MRRLLIASSLLTTILEAIQVNLYKHITFYPYLMKIKKQSKRYRLQMSDAQLETEEGKQLTMNAKVRPKQLPICSNLQD